MKYRQLFEWDESKEWANRMKHGLRFESVLGLWEDKLASEFVDENSTKEIRYIRRGFNELNQFLVVVFTERNDTIRIISARLGTLRERRLHEGRI
ncbi:MAG: BrnT family toxin [Bacteriovoracia bacterium]